MKWRSDQKPNIHLQGPAAHVEVTDNQRIPVDCDFTDELESISVNEYLIQVTYGDSASNAKKVTGSIEDFVTKDKIEYMVMSDGTEIRLDRIRHIDTNS